MSFDVVFMGTPEFAREFLEHIYINKNFNIKAVYTQPSKKAHRGQKINSSSVYKFAKEKNLDIFCPTNFSSSEIETIKSPPEGLKGELTVILSKKIKGVNIRKEITESVKIEIKKMLKKYSHKDVVEYIVKKENLPKKMIYNYCLKLKN